jgi:hypothetical protein
MGLEIDSLLYAILSSLLRNRFVLPLWIRQTDLRSNYYRLNEFLHRIKGGRADD